MSVDRNCHTFVCRDRHHLAVITLAAQPAQKSAFEQLGVEPIGLGAPVLARYGYARCVNDMGLDVARRSQRASQKPSRPASKATQMRLILCPAFSASSRHRCGSFSNVPSSTLSFFNGWRSRYDTGNEPARLAHLNDGDQRAVRFEGIEGSAQVVQLLHGVLHRFKSASMDAISSPPPAP